jgi:lipopolysaccharide biosynthesis glycosyltransferase
MSTMIQAIMENADQQKKYHFFILHKDITDESMELLKAQISHYDCFLINFINVTKYLTGFNFFVDNRKDITEEAYFRLLICKLFADYEKVIYLDGDMICCTDISSLYEYNINDYLIASSRDLLGISGSYIHQEKMAYKKDFLKIKNINNYFNSGMLIFNIKKINNFINFKELLDFAVSKKWKTHDQDILNVLFEDNVLFIPTEWNLSYLSDDRINILPDFLRNEYFNALKQPKIIHFASIKPWMNIVNIPYFELFWKYATRTPFLNTIIERMKNNDLIGKTCKERLLLDIKYRNNAGLLFIVKCIKNWLFRIPKSKLKLASNKISAPKILSVND